MEKRPIRWEKRPFAQNSFTKRASPAILRTTEVSRTLKIEINIDPACPEPRIVIHTDRMTDEIEALVKRLSTPEPDAIPAQTERGVELLPSGEIIRVYTERQKVFAQTAKNVYPLKFRLYEMEKRLEGRSFVRISSSELVNIRMIEGMDFSLAGTIRVMLKGGITTYVSRRHVAEIKKLFDV